MNGPIPLNLNAAVRVMLSGTGLRILHAHHADRGLELWEPWRNPREFTLWQLMQVFGPHIGHGMPSSPFCDNRIEVLDPRV